MNEEKHNDCKGNLKAYFYIRDGIIFFLVVVSSNAIICFCFYYSLLTVLKSKIIPHNTFNFQQFMSQYYMIQANWLNFWLFCLTIILAVIGIIAAIDYKSKKEEMETVIKEANSKINFNELKMNEMDKFISDAKTTIDENVLKMKEYMLEADKSAKEAKESEKISEAYNWFNNGNKAYNAKKYEEAIGNYIKAIEINENFIEAYFSKAEAYLSLQKYDDAISEYKKILELNPNFTDVYYNLIEAYVLIGKLDKAMEMLNIFIQKEPKPYIYKDDYNDWIKLLNKSKAKELAKQIIQFIDEKWRKI